MHLGILFREIICHRHLTLKNLAFRLQFDPDDNESAYMVHKFGMNLAVTAGDDIWDGEAAYTGWAASPFVAEVVSSSAADDVGQNNAHTIRVFGLDANFDPQAADVTLNGEGVVDITGLTWRRIFRAYITSSGSGQTNAGNITIRIDDAGATIAMITAGYGQTEMAIYTIPRGYTGMLFTSDVEVKGESVATVTATAHLDTNQNGQGWRTRHVYDVVNGASQHEYIGGMKLPEKTDIRFRVSSRSKAAPMSAEFCMICLKDK